MAFQGADAIILQSGDMFGIVDSGEDDSYPDGSDERYPWRTGIATRQGLEEELWAELDTLGVNKGNLAFYIGTHPHSDHIGTAAQVIERYQPKLVYTPRYRDEWIQTDSRRWDNRWVYDRLVDATCKAGSTLVQTLDSSAPVIPNDPASACGDVPGAAGSPHITLGDMQIDIVNFKTDYEHPGAIYDANLMSWGVKVTARGRTAFLAADIEKPDEDSVAVQVGGHVDFLKLGHHGTATSNGTSFLNALSPTLAVQTGYVWYLADEPANYMRSHNVEWYPTDEIASAGSRAISVIMDSAGLRVEGTSSGTTVRRRGWGAPRVTAYRNGRPTVLDGWQKFGTEWFWFSSSADATQDKWLLQNGEYYYLQDNAVMATGWASDNGTWYYFGSDGTLSTRSGWFEDNGRWYYLSNGAALTGWQRIGGAWYYMDPANVWMSTGWVWDDRAWYYLESSGAMHANGWFLDGGRWYYLTSNGASTGWLRSGSTWYYMDPVNAWMRTGWVHDGNAWYHLAGSGAMDTGWLRSGGNWYYLNGSGAMATGWVRSGGTWYYMDPVGGAMATGWVRDGSTWYHLAGSGAMDTGWLRSGGNWYYLNGSGAMATGWVHSGSTWYYMDPVSGAMATGWVRDGSTWYHLAGSGAMDTGWLRSGGNWYYLNGSGAMATGWVRSGGTWYYTDPSSGRMLTGRVNVDGRVANFAPSGAWLGYEPESEATPQPAVQSDTTQQS